MINKNYFDNVQSKNVIKDNKKRNLSEDLSFDYSSVSLDNVILNSNLDNNIIIK